MGDHLKLLIGGSKVLLCFKHYLTFNQHWGVPGTPVSRNYLIMKIIQGKINKFINNVKHAAFMHFGDFKDTATHWVLKFSAKLVKS